MRFLVINPNSDRETERILHKSACHFVGDKDTVDVISVVNAPKLIVSYEDQAASAPELISLVREKKHMYDAIVLGCHGDPNLELVRELAADIPVFGIAEASMRMASILYGGFAVLTPSEKIIAKKFALARKYGCENWLKAVVVSKSDDMEHLLEAGREAKAVRGVNAIVLGCANYSGKDGALSRELGLPVLDGLTWAISLAEKVVCHKQYQMEYPGE